MGCKLKRKRSNETFVLVIKNFRCWKNFVGKINNYRVLSNGTFRKKTLFKNYLYLTWTNLASASSLHFLLQVNHRSICTWSATTFRRWRVWALGIYLGVRGYQAGSLTKASRESSCSSVQRKTPRGCSLKPPGSIVRRSVMHFGSRPTFRLHKRQRIKDFVYLSQGG